MGELALNNTTNPIETSAATQTTMTLAGVIVRCRRGTAALVELTMGAATYFLPGCSAGTVTVGI
jgi:hypothetical protein